MNDYPPDWEQMKTERDAALERCRELQRDNARMMAAPGAHNWFPYVEANRQLDWMRKQLAEDKSTIAELEATIARLESLMPKPSVR